MSLHNALMSAKNEFTNDIIFAWTNGSHADRARITGYLDEFKDNFKQVCANIEKNPTADFAAYADFMKNHYRQNNWPVKFAVIFIDRAKMERTVSRIIERSEELERYARGVESWRCEDERVIHKVYGIPEPVEILQRISMNLYGYCTKEKGSYISAECNAPELAGDNEYYPTIYLCTESIKEMPQNHNYPIQEIDVIGGRRISVSSNYFVANGEKLIFAHEFGHLILNHCSIKPSCGFKCGETQANFMAGLFLFDEVASAQMRYMSITQIPEYRDTWFLYVDYAPEDIAQNLYEILVKRVSYDRFPPDIQIKKPSKKKAGVRTSGRSNGVLSDNQKPVIELIVRAITDVLLMDPSVNYKVYSLTPGETQVTFNSAHLDIKVGQLSKFIQLKIHLEKDGCGNRQVDEQYFVCDGEMINSTPDHDRSYLRGAFGISNPKSMRIISQYKKSPETIVVKDVYDTTTNTVDTNAILKCVSSFLSRIENY